MSKKTTIKFFTAICLICSQFCLLSAAWAADVHVSLDRNPVTMGESFQIVFRANAEPDGEPDFSPLAADFEIISQNQSNNVSLINGSMSRTIKWILNVMAKRPGSLEIPAVSFGKDSSSPVPVVVTEKSGTGETLQKDDIFIEVEATPKEPYLQAQVLYTAKIYTRVEIARATLNEPEPADAVVERLGEDKNYQTQLNGVDYLVTERRYALFPQKSGVFSIGPLVLTAEVVSQARSGFNSFFGSATTRTRRVSSKAISLMVKPASAVFSGKHWLAADRLELNEEWSGDLDQAKAGEPVTRTLTLRAEGSTVGQLPELLPDAVDPKLKAYPDKPVLEEKKTDGGIVAIREEKIALIPAEAGEYRLPALEIPWFNTQSGKNEVARLPERLIRVKAGELTAANNETTAAADSKSGGAKTLNTNPPAVESSFWLWTSVALAFGWLVTVAYFLRAGRQRKESPLASASQIKSDTYRQDIKKACSDNDASAAKNALLAWGAAEYGVHSLGALADYCHARLRDEIMTLNRVLYGQSHESWQGKKLFQAFRENKARGQLGSQDDDSLEPLFRL